jgi:phosphoribosylglycinamide formyltransferase-1
MMDDQPRPKLAVLLSGSGRTLDNLRDHINNDSDLNAEIAIVIGSRDCLGVEKAQRDNTPNRVIKGELTSEQLDALIDEFDLDLIILAGYLRRVPITPRARGRILNIHPALLPDFGGPGMHGMHVHNAVHQAYKRSEITHTGCTVHFCDETYDTGDIILQRSCAIEPHDTPQSIADKVFELECETYPRAIKLVLSTLQESR